MCLWSACGDGLGGHVRWRGVWLIEIDGSALHVVFRRMVLAVIISKVSGAWLPVDVVLALINSILKPIESHVDGFGSFLFDGIINDSFSCLIVCAERGAGGGLLVS